MITKNLVRSILLSIGLMAVMQSVFAQTGSVVATVEAIPASDVVDTLSNPAAIPNMSTLASGGAWVNSAGGPTLYSKNVWYYLALNPVGSIPAGATITSVSWSWALSKYPAGLYVYLCHQSGTCGNVTSVRNGSTLGFQTLAANQQMIFAFQVSGTGTMTPVYGQLDQVIVNYQY